MRAGRARRKDVLVRIDAPKAGGLGRPAEHDAPYPAEPSLVVLDRLAPKAKERDKDERRRGEDPPRGVVRVGDLGRDEEGGELRDAREAEVHGGPAGVGAEAERAEGEPEVVRRHREGPDHLDDGHEHEAEVARGGEGGVGRVEVRGEADAAEHEVAEGEAWRRVRGATGKKTKHVPANTSAPMARMMGGIQMMKMATREG